MEGRNMADPTQFQFDIPSAGRPSLFTLEEKFFPGIKDFWSISTKKRTVHPIDGIRAVVIHATAGSSSVGAVSVMKEGKASFHWLVPDEDEEQHGYFVWACAPETLAAFHVQNSKSHPDVNNGKTLVNHWSLGIEIVNSQKTSDKFSAWQVSMAARIVRFCWAKYPNLKHVVSHAKLDPGRRTDPGLHFPWEDFTQQVLNGVDDPVPRMLASVPNAGNIAAIDVKGCCMG
jgi:N-acetyl-anhydromuramyl-L-alanine amidase AmpD